jgi:hypothetical protein
MHGGAGGKRGVGKRWGGGNHGGAGGDSGVGEIMGARVSSEGWENVGWGNSWGRGKSQGGGKNKRHTKTNEG